LLAACSPSEKEIAATFQAETAVSYAATQTAKPTFTLEPTVTFTLSPTSTSTSTPTLTPSPTSTPTPTFTPTPELAMVYGNLQVMLIPYNQDADVPENLGDLSLILKSATGEEEYSTQITEPNGGFNLNLPAGSYRIANVGIMVLENEGLSTWSTIGWPTIMVPEKGCIYTGKLNLIYYKLPPLPLMEQVALVQKIAQGQGSVFSYDENGGLVLASATIDLPIFSERVEGSEACDVELATFVDQFGD